MKVRSGVLPLGPGDIERVYRVKLLSIYTAGLFLYFPEDKSEYIPAAITSVIFLVAAAIVMRLIIKYSRKEEGKAKELEDRILGKQKKEEGKR